MSANVAAQEYQFTRYKPSKQMTVCSLMAAEHIGESTCEVSAVPEKFGIAKILEKNAYIESFLPLKKTLNLPNPPTPDTKQELRLYQISPLLHLIAIN